MKTILISVFVLFFIVAGYSQEMSIDEARKLGEPGPPHEMLKSLEGSYSITFSYWMMPGQDPMKASGTVENKMILGGRFLESRSSMTMMGDEVETLHIMGFDNRIKKHTFYGFDEFGTYGISAEGDYDEAAKTITWYFTDSLSAPGKQMNIKMLLIMADTGSYTFEVHFQGSDGNYSKSVEVVATKS